MEDDRTGNSARFHILSEITNIVAKYQIKPLCLTHVVSLLSLPTVRYNPSKFPAAFVKLREGSCNIFSTGTVVFLGYKNINLIYQAIDELADKITPSYFSPVDSQLKICNVAATFNVTNYSNFNLSSLVKSGRTNQSTYKLIYEPELSNSLHIYFEASHRVILHASGKGIITGAKSEGELNDIVNKLRMLLQNIDEKTHKQSQLH